MKNINFKKELIFWPLLILPFAYIIYIWGQLPDQIAIHFNLQGEANGWGGKWSLLGPPVINIIVYLVTLFMPVLDPKRMNKEDFNPMFYKIRLLVIFFVCITSFIGPQGAIHGKMSQSIPHLIPVSVFLLLAILGNFMINIKPNWFIGVRTPWTLSSDYVWRRTHQIMGKTWFYGGLLCASLTFVVPDKWTEALILVFALGTTLFAFAYSFFLYKQEQTKSTS